LSKRTDVHLLKSHTRKTIIVSVDELISMTTSFSIFSATDLVLQSYETSMPAKLPHFPASTGSSEQ
jgi:hypothetical protein